MRVHEIINNSSSSSSNTILNFGINSDTSPQSLSGFARLYFASTELCLRYLCLLYTFSSFGGFDLASTSLEHHNRKTSSPVLFRFFFFRSSLKPCMTVTRKAMIMHKLLFVTLTHTKRNDWRVFGFVNDTYVGTSSEVPNATFCEKGR